MNALDDFLNAEFTRELQLEAEAKARLEALHDPFKRKRTEPGRARLKHGEVPTKRTTLGGSHS